jgi:hypothetical protein
MHYTDYPKYFLENKDRFAGNGAIVFEKADYLKLFVWLMGKRYDKMAASFVNLNDVYKSDEEVIAMLRGRTKKLNKDAWPLPEKPEAMLGN